jgi:hypothetical protein
MSLERILQLAGVPAKQETKLTESVEAIPGVDLRTINRQVDEKAPKGWEGTVKAMKKHSEIDNPWALAHYMKNKGYKSHKEESVGVEEKAPPGMEDMVLKLKKEYPGHPEKAFATAWSIYNKKHGTEEGYTMEEEINGTPDVDLCKQSNPAAARDACHMEENLMYQMESDGGKVQEIMDKLGQLSGLGYGDEEAFNMIAAQLSREGYEMDEINELFHAVDVEMGVAGDPGEFVDQDEPMEPNDSSADAEWLASAGRGSDEDYGHFGGGDEFEEDMAMVGQSDPVKVGKALKDVEAILADNPGLKIEVVLPKVAKMRGVRARDLSQMWHRVHSTEEDVLGPVAEAGKPTDINPEELNAMAKMPFDAAKAEAERIISASTTTSDKKAYLLNQIQRQRNVMGLVSLLYNMVLKGEGHGVQGSHYSRKFDRTEEAVAEDFDLNNGYDDINNADPQSYFPTGADSPVTVAIGGNAKSGDNPEQKRVAVAKESADIHKELVYNYRNFLKEDENQKKN